MHVIALLGRQDTPVDGVEDYCTFLGALEAMGIELDRVRVQQDEKDWIRVPRECQSTASKSGRGALIDKAAIAALRS